MKNLAETLPFLRLFKETNIKAKIKWGTIHNLLLSLLSMFKVYFFILRVSE